MMNNIQKFGNWFFENTFLQKTKKLVRRAGLKTSYSALLLFYSYTRKETPLWAKHIIIGALGYLLAPFDALPDLTPIIGFTDDLGVLSFGLVTIAGYINDDVRIKARKKLKEWFGEFELNELADVDAHL